MEQVIYIYMYMYIYIYNLLLEDDLHCRELDLLRGAAPSDGQRVGQLPLDKVLDLPVIYIYIYMHVIYIYRERERRESVLVSCRWIKYLTCPLYIYIYICTLYIYIEREREERACWSAAAG